MPPKLDLKLFCNRDDDRCRAWRSCCSSPRNRPIPCDCCTRPRIWHGYITTRPFCLSPRRDGRSLRDSALYPRCSIVLVLVGPRDCVQSARGCVAREPRQVGRISASPADSRADLHGASGDLGVRSTRSNLPFGCSSRNLGSWRKESGCVYSWTRDTLVAAPPRILIGGRSRYRPSDHELRARTIPKRGYTRCMLCKRCCIW